jgi:chemotaxis response regulator CheB
LFGALPDDTGMSFAVVQHLSREHPSILARTLARFTSMPVIEIQDGTRLAPDHVYVMPPNTEVHLVQGVLRLAPRPASPGGRLPIDLLFRSLAEELHSRAIGVVLPGTGKDAPPLPASPGADVKGVWVLVVEDDEGTRECLVEILSAAGARVRAAATVLEGIDALSEFRPDVLLSDLAMPGQDGFTLIAHVRGLPPERGGRMPAAAVSALVGVDDRQRALEAGFQLHIPKPVDIDGLLTAVARLAAMRPSA